MLSVAPTADTEEIRAAYRAQVRALHPDSRDPALDGRGADEALRLVTQAWYVLADRDRRRTHDRDLGLVGADRWSDSDDDGEDDAWRHPGRRGFPWWIVVLAVLLVIFVFTAYAGTPVPVEAPTGR